jgi:hypothetical protein
MRCTGFPLRKPRLFPVYIGTVERDLLFQQAKMTARAQGESTTALLVRTLTREIARCRLEAGIAGRLAAGDRAEIEVLALLSDEEKKEYGL